MAMMIRTKADWKKMGEPAGYNPHWRRRSGDKFRARKSVGRYDRILMHAIHGHGRHALRVKLCSESWKTNSSAPWLSFKAAYPEVAALVEVGRKPCR